MDQTLKPNSDRILYLDVIRGIAVLGILVMNIPGFALPRDYSDNIVRFGGAHSLDYYTWLFDYIFLDGKMRYLLGIAFGAGIILFTSRKEGDGLRIADIYFRRILWLLVLSLIFCYLFLIQVHILYEYALCGMLLFAFRNAAPKWLFLMAAISLTIFSVKTGIGFWDTKEKREIAKEAYILKKEGKTLTKEQQDALDFNNKAFTIGPNKELVDNYNRDIRSGRSGYLPIFEINAEMTTEAFSVGFYQGFWETFAGILVGMGLFNMGFFSGHWKKSTYLLIALVALTAGVTINSYMGKVRTLSQLDNTGWYFDTRTFSVMHMMQFARTFLVIGYVALIVLLCQVNWLKKINKVLAAVGRMSFTNYITANIFCSLFFFGYGLGNFGYFRFWELHYIVAMIWLVQIVFSVVWLRKYKFGPFEWLWRRLTYGKSLSLATRPGTN